MSRLRLGVMLALAMLALGGCGEERPDQVTRLAPVAGFRPDLFPDIPMPRAGYQFDVGIDQLAVVMAGGAVRRYDVAYIRRENATEQSGSALLAEYHRDLEQVGWTLTHEDDGSQAWRKGSEELRLETGRSDGRTTLQIHLRPVQP
jgi:hypothetical protein